MHHRTNEYLIVFLHDKNHEHTLFHKKEIDHFSYNTKMYKIPNYLKKTAEENPEIKTSSMKN